MTNVGKVYDPLTKRQIYDPLLYRVRRSKGTNEVEDMNTDGEAPPEAEAEVSPEAEADPTSTSVSAPVAIPVAAPATAPVPSPLADPAPAPAPAAPPAAILSDIETAPKPPENSPSDVSLEPSKGALEWFLRR